MGSCSLYRRFAPNFVHAAKLFNKRLKKDEPTGFEIDDNDQQTANDLKHNLTSVPVLALSILEKQYVVETDSCNKHVGCVLLFEQEFCELWPITYKRTLDDSKKN